MSRRREFARDWTDHDLPARAEALGRFRQQGIARESRIAELDCGGDSRRRVLETLVRVLRDELGRPNPDAEKEF